MPRETDLELARSMVMQDGTWYIPGRAMAEFTGEISSDVKSRAHDCAGQKLIQANRSQIIDITLHSFSATGKRGPSGKRYSRESPFALLNITTNFTLNWTREKAIEAVTEAFDWVEANGNTSSVQSRKVMTAGSVSLSLSR
ncbi:MAG: hypothetical protein ACYCXP_00840 [Leptospirillum sp.]